MGASLCIFRHSSSSTTQRSEPKRASNRVGGNGNSRPYWCDSAILDLIRRPGGCLQKDQEAKKKAILQSPSDHNQKIKKRSKVRGNKLTLEDWLSASPGKKPNQISGGELYMFRHSRKIHPSSRPALPSSSSHHNSTICSSSTTTTLASKAIDSFCLEPIIKSTTTTTTTTTTNGEADQNQLDVDHDHQLLAGASSNSMRSQSGRSTKKVSFREEPDIIIIYSPEKDEDFRT